MSTREEYLKNVVEELKDIVVALEAKISKNEPLERDLVYKFIRLYNDDGPYYLLPPTLKVKDDPNNVVLKRLEELSKEKDFAHRHRWDEPDTEKWERCTDIDRLVREGYDDLTILSDLIVDNYTEAQDSIQQSYKFYLRGQLTETCEAEPIYHSYKNDCGILDYIKQIREARAKFEAFQKENQ